MICRDCHRSRQRNRAERYLNRWVYRDEDGRRWHGSRCQDCHNVAARPVGGSSWNDPKDPHQRRARRAEVVAAEHFRNQGFRVFLKKVPTGPDLVLNNGQRVEVKMAGRYGRRLTVQPVSPKRRDDDLIAIVLLPNQVVVQEMKSHLSLCNRHGARSVTGLFRPPCQVTE